MIDTTEAIARVLDDVRDLKTRVTAQEEGQARILHAIVGVQSSSSTAWNSGSIGSSGSRAALKLLTPSSRRLEGDKKVILLFF